MRIQAYVDKNNLYTLLTFVLHSMVAAATALSLMSISSIAFNKKKKKENEITINSCIVELRRYLTSKELNYIKMLIRWPLALYSSLDIKLR